MFRTPGRAVAVHNVRMKSTLVRLASVALVGALTLSGCGGGDGGDGDKEEQTTEGASSGPTEVETEDDGTTAQGSELSLGETATMKWSPRANLTGTVDITVTKIIQAPIKDFSGFKLTKEMKKSTPYYVKAKVTNAGSSNLSGVELPLFLDNGSDVLFPSAQITSSFKPCPSKPLPKKFTNGKSTNLCLVYLAAQGTKMEFLALRPSEDFEPIVWEAEVTKPKPKKDKGKKKGKKKS